MFPIKKYGIPLAFLLAGGAAAFGLQSCNKDTTQAKADQPAASSSASAQVPATPQAPIMVTGEKQAPKMDQATWVVNTCKTSAVWSAIGKGYAGRYLPFKENDVIKVVDLCGGRGVEEVDYKIVKCGDFNDLYIETTGRFQGKKGFYRIGDPFNAANDKDGRLAYVNAADVLPLSEAKLTLAYWAKDGSRHDVPKDAKLAIAQLVDSANCGDGPVMAVSYSKPVGKAVAEPGGGPYVTLAAYQVDQKKQAAKDAEQDEKMKTFVTVAELSDFQKICGGKEMKDCNFALFHGPRAKGN